MIIELYNFAPGSYVVADEWNSNFSVLQNTASQHSEAITDAYNEIAFPNSDLSAVFSVIQNKPNSESFTGSNTITVSAEREYYTTLSSGQDFQIKIDPGMNGESRVLFQLQENRSLLPFSVSYSGTKIINHYNNYVFRSGYYYVMIHESNGVAQVKLIWTGV